MLAGSDDGLLVFRRGWLRLVPDHLGLSRRTVLGLTFAFRTFMAVPVRIVLATVLVLLRRHRRLRSSDNTIVVLRVLKIVFSHHTIPGRVRVTGKLEILLIYVLRRAANFHVRAGRFEIAMQNILRALTAASASTASSATAVAIAATITLATEIILLRPHVEGSLLSC